MTAPATEETPDEMPGMVTVAEACRQLGISKVKFYELLNGGHIATVLPTPGGGRGKRRVGHGGPRASRRIEQAEINAFIERNRETAQ